MASERKRDWCFIVYPDSCPQDWIEILLKDHLCFGVSPLHDSDKNGDDTEKKPHWHVYVKFSGLKSYDQILEITKSVNGTIPVAVKNPVGMIRYFVHIDNPEKHPYNISDIQSYCGFQVFVEEAFKIGLTDINAILSEMQDWIVENQITEYSDLWVYSIDLPKWRYVLNMYNCNSVNRLITSIRLKNRNG